MFGNVETEHELKTVRKRVTSFVSDDTAESFLFSLCFKRSLYLRKDLNPSCTPRKIDSSPWSLAPSSCS